MIKHYTLLTPEAAEWATEVLNLKLGRGHRQHGSNKIFFDGNYICIHDDLHNYDCVYELKTDDDVTVPLKAMQKWFNDPQTKLNAFGLECDKLNSKIAEFQSKYPDAKPCWLDTKIIWHIDAEKLISKN